MINNPGSNSITGITTGGFHKETVCNNSSTFRYLVYATLNIVNAVHI